VCPALHSFLELMRRHPASFVVPTYQVDLCWHSHILGGLAAYEADGARLTGRTSAPDHDDSVRLRALQAN